MQGKNYQRTKKWLRMYCWSRKAAADSLPTHAEWNHRNLQIILTVRLLSTKAEGALQAHWSAVWSVKGQISVAPSCWAHVRHLCWPEITLRVSGKPSYPPQELSEDSLSEVWLFCRNSSDSFHFGYQRIETNNSNKTYQASLRNSRNESWTRRICGKRAEVIWYRQCKHPCKWLWRFRAESTEPNGSAWMDPHGLRGPGSGLNTEEGGPSSVPSQTILSLNGSGYLGAC